VYAGLGDAALHVRRFSRLRKKREYGKILWYTECCHRDVGASMRGGDRNTGALFSYVSCEARVAKSHPLRAIRQIVDAALLALSPDFEALYARLGGHQSRPRSCFERCYCRRSIRCGRSGS
jgi:hypothetical protein